MGLLSAFQSVFEKPLVDRFVPKLVLTTPGTSGVNFFGLLASAALAFAAGGLASM